MHAMGLHSALAIKRQRKRREEQRRARERRFSTQSNDSGLTSPHHSMGSLSGAKRANRSAGGDVGSKVVTSVGMMHIGVVFVVLGAFLLVSGLLPDDLTSWTHGAGGWFNELTITGALALVLGIFLVVLNRIITRHEEDELTDYVQRQLTRSRSGHALVRDVETGCLTTRQQQRAKPLDEEVAVHSPTLAVPTTLELIREEDTEKGEEESRNHSKELISNGSTTGGSLSPGSPSETKELLSARARFLNM